MSRSEFVSSVVDFISSNTEGMDVDYDDIKSIVELSLAGHPNSTFQEVEELDVVNFAKEVEKAVGLI